MVMQDTGFKGEENSTLKEHTILWEVRKCFYLENYSKSPVIPQNLALCLLGYLKFSEINLKIFYFN